MRLYKTCLKLNDDQVYIINVSISLIAILFMNVHTLIFIPIAKTENTRPGLQEIGKV